MSALDANGQPTEESSLYVTMKVSDQLFGIPVLSVRDVLGQQRITKIPLAPKEVAGALNLRGRIVTAIDLRLRLGVPARDQGVKEMSVVVEHGAELYSLLVDSVGEVMGLNREWYERNPATLDPRWREVSSGIFRLDGKLLVVLDVDRVLDFEGRASRVSAASAA